MYSDIASLIWEKVVRDREDLPKMLWEENPTNCLEVNISLVSHYRQDVSAFFYHMISRWLIPEIKLDVKLHFSTQLECEKKVYSVCQLILVFKTVEKSARAKHNFPFLEKEILLGATSLYHATKILEMKGMTLDDRTAFVQDKIGRLVQRFPEQFDYDIFPLMQRFLVAFEEEFRSVRQPAEIARLIYVLYSFRKKIKERSQKYPSKRHIQLKLKKILLHTPFGIKEVVSVFLGLNFLKEHELFEERHFLSAIAHLVPGIQSIPSSYYSVEGENQQIHTFYLEIEKEDRSIFSIQELSELEKKLEAEVATRIEQLVPPIFMPRNEEEVMRNILTLSHQLKYLRDLPQMSISFDEQTDVDLSFTIILVRIIQPDSIPIRELLSSSKISQNLSIDRIKVVGTLRRKYPKEACVLRIRMPSSEFLRGDYSVDLFQARLNLVKEIEEILGEVRDYNGGMISKQSENFIQLQKEMGKAAKKHALLLQNFFHSIFPASLSSTADPKLLKILFCMLLDAMVDQESTVLKAKYANDSLFAILKLQDFSIRQKIFNQIEGLKIPSNELLSIQLQVFDSSFLGFIYLNPEKEKQKNFLAAIPEGSLTFLQNASY